VKYQPHLQIAFRYSESLLYPVKLVIAFYDGPVINQRFFQVGIIAFDAEHVLKINVLLLYSRPHQLPNGHAYTQVCHLAIRE